MDLETIQNLYSYNYWANGRILDTVARVDAAHWTEPAGLSHTSLQDTLAHILAAEWVWRMRTQERISPTGIPPEWGSFDLESLQARWQEEERRMRSYLASLDDAGLQERIPYQNTRGGALPEAAVADPGACGQPRHPTPLGSCHRAHFAGRFPGRPGHDLLLVLNPGMISGEE
jgi:uncharacterized damage-inducible protein DinB